LGDFPFLDQKVQCFICPSRRIYNPSILNQ
jgi:hypothetical protein